MALTNEEYARIASFLSDELPENERVTLLEWRKARAVNEGAFQDTKTIWENSGIRLTDDTLDTGKEWLNLRAAMEGDEKRGIVALPFRVNDLMKIAASLLVVALVGYWLLDTTTQEKDTTISATGEVMMFYLPDSTRVWLNTHSSLSYAPSFGSSERSVSLHGEGYFDVKRDEVKPFLVATGDVVIQVLGTSFNVKEEDQRVSLTVAEGVVKFSPRDNTQHEGIIVQADEMAHIETAKAPEKSKNTNPAFASWRKDNNPVYEQEKISPKQYIQTDFKWRKNAINQSVITGTLKNSAGLATYKNIVLLVEYTNPKGKAMTSRVTIEGPVLPGKTLPFEKRLLDIFRDTRALELTVESAEVDN